LSRVVKKREECVNLVPGGGKKTSLEENSQGYLTGKPREHGSKEHGPTVGNTLEKLSNRNEFHWHGQNCGAETEGRASSRSRVGPGRKGIKNKGVSLRAGTLNSPADSMGKKERGPGYLRGPKHTDAAGKRGTHTAVPPRGIK